MALYLFVPQQAATSARFVVGNLLSVAPFLLLSVGIAAYVGASDADGLVARAFTGTPGVMIVVAAIAGGFAPFCSCGVIPADCRAFGDGRPSFCRDGILVGLSHHGPVDVRADNGCHRY